MSDQLIIGGFHRSGTSATARLLHRAGLFLGYELLEALPSNPYGHFEDREVVDLHRHILNGNEQTWLVDEPHLEGEVGLLPEPLVHEPVPTVQE